MTARPPAGSVALLGFAGAGKTTLFALLTGTDPARISAQSASAPVAGRVAVPDPRLDELHAAAGGGRERVPVAVELFDMPPVDPGDAAQNASLLGTLRTLDGFIGVLGAHLAPGDGRAEAERQRNALSGLLGTADLEVIGRRIEAIERRARRLPAKEREIEEAERDALRAIADALLAGRSDAARNLDPAMERRLRGFSFFSAKPVVWITNAAESDLPLGPDATSFVLERELLSMPPEERGEFLSAYGLDEPVVPSLPRRILEALGALTFFTIGEREVAAWPVRRGAAAPEAAGRIHSDMQERFIAAEVVPFDEWRAHRAAQRPAPRPRLEGREYVIRDGDIIQFRFGR